MINIQSKTLTEENFPSISLEGLKKVLINKCFVEMVKDSTWLVPAFEGDILHECKCNTHFLYFTSNDSVKPNVMRRYHMIVFSSLAIEIYYKDSNVIDGDKNYMLEDVKTRYKNHITALYNELKNI